jgi:hypothetical protein
MTRGLRQDANGQSEMPDGAAKRDRLRRWRRISPFQYDSTARSPDDPLTHETQEVFTGNALSFQITRTDDFLPFRNLYRLLDKGVVHLVCCVLLIDYT